jgi:cytochrome P450
MQKDLLAPQSAKEYLPAMLQAATKVSPKASQWAKKGEIHRFLNFFSMDLFNALLFGGRDKMAEGDYERFCEAAVDGLNISQWRLKQVLEHIESGNATDIDKGSYFSKALQRMDDSDLSMDEVLEIGVILMMASVDTTSAKIAWNVLQLALNPEVQDRLRTEILLAVEREGGVLTPAVMDVPYLKAFVRKTHRCTPVSPFTIVKKLQLPINIHGEALPVGSVVALEAQTHHFNPDFVEDPFTFKPERWLSDAVDARKNSPAAIIDHPFLSGPFSQGARRCPGSRVAYLEVQVALAQLVMDWNIHGPNMHWNDVPNTLGTLVVPIFPAGVGFSPRLVP